MYDDGKQRRAGWQVIFRPGARLRFCLDLRSHERAPDQKADATAAVSRPNFHVYVNGKYRQNWAVPLSTEQAARLLRQAHRFACANSKSLVVLSDAGLFVFGAVMLNTVMQMRVQYASRSLHALRTRPVLKRRLCVPCARVQEHSFTLLEGRGLRHKALLERVSAAGTPLLPALTRLVCVHL
jgi:hypothetical protein